jgi:hypothetical protein
MDFGSGMIGILLLIFCIIIFVILSRSNRKKDKELLQSLFKTADQSNYSISQYDIWGNSAIGIDKKDKIIFAITHSNNNPVYVQVNLTEIKNCRVIRTNKTVRDEKNSYEVIEKLEMAFSYQEKNKQDMILPFYDAEYEYSTLNGELQLIEKWCLIANGQLTHKSLQA